MPPRHTSSPEERMRIGEAARLAGVAVETLRRWANSGLVPYERRPSGDRVFLRGDIENLTRPDDEPGPGPNPSDQPDQPAAATG